MVLPNPFNLSSLDGNNGFVINGIDTDDNSGVSVSSAGDVNGDGIDDIIIGGLFADPNGNNNAGESYIVFGKNSGFGSSLNLSTLDGNNGFVINGIDTDDNSGVSVSSAGDVNGDGFDDIIIGANGGDPNGNNGAGESYIVFGKNSGFNSSLNLSTLDGNSGFVLSGIDPNDQSSRSVSSAGDVNGDGIDDIIIGGLFADPNGNNNAGESYIVFGTDSGFGSSLNLSTLDGNNGFVLNGIDSFDTSGTSVSSTGDINGDGFDDIIIGARDADPNSNSSAGESYVVFGTDSGFGSSLNLSSLNGTNGFAIDGIGSYDNSGTSVSSAGDVNGDGFDDIIIGAFGGDPNGNNDAGESYIVFGTDSGFSSSLNLSSLNGTNGFVLNGINEGDRSGRSVSSAGDVNGDGIDDIIIGAYRGDPNGNNDAGESYVVFGTDSGFSSSLNLSSLNGTNGFVINGIGSSDNSGRSVSSAGDVNGDGIDDIIIGADFTYSDSNSGAGETYVVFGTRNINGTPNADLLNGTLDNDIMRGLGGNDTINGATGNDSLLGNGGNDSLNGNNGDDILRGGFGNDSLLGAEGDDTLRGQSGDDSLLGAEGDDSLLGGRGKDILNGATGKDTLNGGHDDDLLQGGDSQDLLRGGDGNDTLIGGEGNDLAFGGDDSDVFVLESNSDRIRIRDYVDNTDKIGLSGNLTFSDLRIVNNGSGNKVLIRDLSNSNAIMGVVFDDNNVLDAEDFTESDFVDI